jgi:hypothetical protein
MIVPDFHRFALGLAPAGAAVANYCDHAEHNEVTDPAWVLEAGHVLRTLSCEFAFESGLEPIELYGRRLEAIESRNVLSRPGGYEGRREALEAETWRDLQLIQVEHDRFYHPDVLGLAKQQQLQHYALHLAKSVGAFAEARDAGDLLHRRLPDVLLFGIKLPTVMNVRLGDEPLPRISDRNASGSAVVG